MRYGVISLLILCCGCCGDTPTETIIETDTVYVYIDTSQQDGGVERTFVINISLEVCSDPGAAEAWRATQSNADIYCISLGYEYATWYTGTEDKYLCGSSMGWSWGCWLKTVTCWKPSP